MRVHLPANPIYIPLVCPGEKHVTQVRKRTHDTQPRKEPLAPIRLLRILIRQQDMVSINRFQAG